MTRQGEVASTIFVGGFIGCFYALDYDLIYKLKSRNDGRQLGLKNLTLGFDL